MSSIVRLELKELVMGRPKIGGLEALMSLRLLEDGKEHVALLLEGGHILTTRDGQNELISLGEHVHHVTVEERGVVVHPGPTGCLGGLFAGAANAAMERKGIDQGRIRFALKSGIERTFSVAPDDLVELAKALRQMKIPVDG